MERKSFEYYNGERGIEDKRRIKEGFEKEREFKKSEEGIKYYERKEFFEFITYYKKNQTLKNLKKYKELKPSFIEFNNLLIMVDKYKTKENFEYLKNLKEEENK